MSDLIGRISRLKFQGEIFCVATVVESYGATPRKAGAKALIFPDKRIEGTVGGGSIELTAIKVALDVILSGKPLLKKFELDKLEDGAMSCGGTMTLFFEPVLSERLLTIFGGGHVGRALANVASIAGWQIRVIDEREGILDKKYFPEQAELIYNKYTTFIKNTKLSSNDWLTIVTPKHKNDEEVLELIIKQPVVYIGMMGSPKKVKEIKANLVKKDISEKYLSKIFAPIGLNVGIETPGEIAVSIVAEMLSVYYQINKIKSCSK